MKQLFKLGAWVLLALIGLSLFGLVAKIMFFPANVAHTAINSANGVVSKTLDSANVLHSYEWFFDVNANTIARVNQIRAHAKLRTEETDAKERSRLAIDLSAMQQSCRDLVTKYNANSAKANKTMFKSNNLPEVLSIAQCEVQS